MFIRVLLEPNIFTVTHKVLDYSALSETLKPNKKTSTDEPASYETHESLPALQLRPRAFESID